MATKSLSLTPRFSGMLSVLDGVNRFNGFQSAHPCSFTLNGEFQMGNPKQGLAFRVLRSLRFLLCYVFFAPFPSSLFSPCESRRRQLRLPTQHVK